MPRCDASRFLICVLIPKSSNIEPKDYTGDAAQATLDAIIEKGYELRIEEFIGKSREKGKKALCQGQTLRFHNFLANTGEVADLIGVEPKHIVKFIDDKTLSGAHSPNNFYRFVVRDQRLASFLKGKQIVVSKKKQRYKGRGLKQKIWDALDDGLIPSTSFGVSDIKKGLVGHSNWRVGKEYSHKSILSAMTCFEREGKVALKRDGRVVDRIWGVVASRVAMDVAPADRTIGDQLDQMVERLADAVVTRVEKRAKEKLGL